MGSHSKTKAPEQTLEESRYLRRLIEGAVPVRIKLADDEIIEGTIEFYDVHFLRVTRKDGPNLFVYKHDIKYLSEV